jgi:hypothetical protein
LGYYAAGLRKIYPDQKIEASLLLTHTQQLQTVDLV